MRQQGSCDKSANNNRVVTLKSGSKGRVKAGDEASRRDPECDKDEDIAKDSDSH